MALSKAMVEKTRKLQEKLQVVRSFPDVSLGVWGGACQGFVDRTAKSGEESP
jgi:hypothetical protein